MIKTFAKLLVAAFVTVASVTVWAETKIPMNAKSLKEIDSLCESLGKFGGKVFAQMVREGNASELIGKAKQMDKNTGLLMLAAAEEAVHYYSDATRRGVRDVASLKGLAETAAYVRCQKMIDPKLN